ncbi:response regulator [Massilia endophytica]|uniref:response regulator n=1 Tax=Massilia endophytica TaxID=2899220 RepID=UPI001E35235A|nr:response regulator [Massilia endophytica]UGQ48231.1 response regulator [Massilia endophytica]
MTSSTDNGPKGPGASGAGPVEHWPLPMRLTVDIMRNTPLPMVLMWGRQQIMLYNAAYAELAGLPPERTPGGRVPAIQPDAWSWDPSVIEAVWAGEVRDCPRQTIKLMQGGAITEHCFDLHYTPIREEGGAVAGVLCALAPPSAAPPEAEAQPLSILVVEDNLDAQYLVCEMLRTFGHEVEAAGSAEEALQMLEGRHFEILLSDVSLPGISGVELGRRALRRQPGLHVVFASGYSNSLTDQLDFPALSIQKPYDIEQLQAILQRAAAAAQ